MILILTIVLVIIGIILMITKRREATIAMVLCAAVFFLFGAVIMFGLTVATNQCRAYEIEKRQEILAKQNAKIRELEDVIEKIQDEKPILVIKLEANLEKTIKEKKAEEQKIAKVNQRKNTYLRLLWPLYE